MSTPELSYEEAREQLIEVVRQLESGNVALSQSMELWERGEKLAGICEEWLTSARQRIEQAKPVDGRNPAAH